MRISSVFPMHHKPCYARCFPLLHLQPSNPLSTRPIPRFFPTRNPQMLWLWISPEKSLMPHRNPKCPQQLWTLQFLQTLSLPRQFLPSRIIYILLGCRSKQRKRWKLLIREYVMGPCTRNGKTKHGIGTTPPLHVATGQTHFKTTCHNCLTSFSSRSLDDVDLATLSQRSLIIAGDVIAYRRRFATSGTLVEKDLLVRRYLAFTL